jgi:hypothetical protein
MYEHNSAEVAIIYIVTACLLLRRNQSTGREISVEPLAVRVQSRIINSVINHLVGIIDC